MPELPEVETTLSSLRPHLFGARITQLVVRERRLRWPIEAHLEDKVRDQRITRMRRRGKYIVIDLELGGLLMHLGMSGSFKVLPKGVAGDRYERHDHYDLHSSHSRIIRYRDPRRFGCLLWSAADPMQHPLIRNLGVEPLEAKLDGNYLHRVASRRTVSVKILLMDSRIVVGVGNIYAAEALFDAGIHPLRGCHRISVARYQRLTESVQKILRAAILQGGSTIRDFAADGEPGYFKQHLLVYGRTGQPCRLCATRIRNITIGQRSTFYCPNCQH